MNIVSAVSEHSILQEAILEVCDKAKTQLQGKSVDLAILFVSPEHIPASINMPGLLSRHLNAATIVGCSGSGVISGEREYEKSPAVVLTAAHLNKVKAAAFEVRPSKVPNSDAPPDEWLKFLPNHMPEPSAILLLPDPYTIDSEHILAGFDYSCPRSAKFGGLVSGMKSAGAHSLFIQDTARKDGMVGVALYGDVLTKTIVSHGCKPIGPQIVVTSAKGNSILELDGKEPVKKISEVFDEASDKDQKLMRQHLQIGFPIDTLAQEWHTGDFVIRNVIGLNGHEGSIKIGANVRNGQVVQFHVLDPDYAKRELGGLSEHAEKRDIKNNGGALLFSCVTRGKNLFKDSNRDASALRKAIQSLPISGVFSNGQISSYSAPDPTTDGENAINISTLHGYTATATIIQAPTPKVMGKINEGPTAARKSRKPTLSKRPSKLESKDS